MDTPRNGSNQPLINHFQSGIEGVPDKYYTGTGQTIIGLHKLEACAGRHCVIHNPSSHHMRDWPTHWRDDRRIMERICPHGVGHPDPDDNTENKIHGCDGCCTETIK